MTRESNYSTSYTDGCAGNLGDEHKNEEYEEYIETTPEKSIALNKNLAKE